MRVFRKFVTQSRLPKSINLVNDSCSPYKRIPGKSSFGALGKSLLPLAVVLDDQSARSIGAQPPPALHGQQVRKLQAAGTLDSLEGHLEVGDGLGVVDAGIWQDECADGNVSAHAAVLGEDDLVKVRGHGDGRRRANHLVLDVPLVVDGVLLGQIQRARDDAHRGIALGQAAAEVLKVRPVVAVEALADLRAHVAEVKGLVHGALRPLCVGGGHLVASVVAAAEVVLEQGAELLRHAGVLEEDAVLAVAAARGERLGRDVLDDPVRVARAAVVARDEGGAGRDVGDGAWEAVLEEAAWVDGRCWAGDDGQRSAAAVTAKDLVGGDGCGDGCGGERAGGGGGGGGHVCDSVFLTERVESGCESGASSSAYGGDGNRRFEHDDGFIYGRYICAYTCITGRS